MSRGSASHRILDAFAFGEDNLRRACAALGVEPRAVLFVGDSLAEVQRAADAGMTTAQALWFRADDTPGIEADFQASRPWTSFRSCGD